MPKASLAGVGQRSKSNLNFGEGFGEITAANVSVYQLSASKKTGAQSEPFVSVNLTLQRINADGAAIGDDVFVEHLSAGSIRGGQAAVHVGLAVDANDDDPKDMGIDLDSSEGNTVWVPAGGDTVNENTKYGIFSDSLVAAGFDEAVVRNLFIPDLIGLKAYFRTESRTLSNGNKGAYLIVEKGKIIALPYESNGAKPKAKPALVSQPKGVATNGQAALAEGQAEQLVAHIAQSNPGKAMPKANFAQRITMLTAKWPKDQQQHVQKLLKDDEWLIGAILNENGTLIDDVVTFGSVTY